MGSSRGERDDRGSPVNPQVMPDATARTDQSEADPERLDLVRNKPQ